ncbi:MAG TPA: MBL fold metallo-hydrolase, partial [Usitatibacter sp.]|nr:MBL fold metallo-hydrolase [Usitatibacter sp.]
MAAAPFPRASAEEARPTADAKPKSRLILLGTAGGPTPKPNRSAPAQVIVVNGTSYVIDCGNGVARQMVLAKLKLSSMRSVFITHHHSDHNADYGNLLLLAWATDLTKRIDTYGPPPLAQMTRLFLELNDYDIRTRIADEGRPPLKDLIAPHEITAGGPTPKPNRSAPANVIVVNGASYVVDCGNGVARQMVLAKLKLSSMRSVF